MSSFNITPLSASNDTLKASRFHRNGGGIAGASFRPLKGAGPLAKIGFANAFIPSAISNKKTNLPWEVR